MKLKYFTLQELCFSETAQRNNITNIPTFDIVFNLFRLGFVLDQVRAEFGFPIYVTSGYRCKELNFLVGGATDSEHMFGNAVDITCDVDKLDILYSILDHYSWSERYINMTKGYIHLAL
jgi:uncharacterized protein YcbK (DUF882 family)